MTVNSLNLIRSNPAHAGSGQLVSLAGRETENTVPENPGKANLTSFDRYLIDAVDRVNQKQVAVTDMAQRLVTDPGSVDPHDITVAMAKANLSLSIAQNVISRLTQAWNEITSNR